MAVQHNKQYFHQECLNEKIQNAHDRKELIEYICKIYHIEAPTGLILKQIKDYQEQYKYKIKGMLLALKYFHETLGNQARDGDGIGIIPFIYEEAKRNYVMRLKVEESLENIQQQKQTKVVEVVSPQFNYKKNIKQIDINLL